ncbi:MAG: hypothetical protein AB7G12_04715 [Thermoanaerobaculia bacterium]
MVTLGANRETRRLDRRAPGATVRALVTLLLAVAAPRVATGQLLGGEIPVNSYTTDSQWWSAAAPAGNEGFVIVWMGQGDGDANGIYGQRFDASGVPDGDEFPVNTYTTLLQEIPAVAGDASGAFVVAWTSYLQEGPALGSGVYAQRFDASGVPQGDEFHVNTYTTADQKGVSVAAEPGGEFAAVWWSVGQDGSAEGVYTQRYSAAGVPIGDEERVNSTTAGQQWRPAIAADAAGNFVVAWSSDGQDGDGHGVFARQIDSLGLPYGPEIPVNQFTTGEQTAPSVACGAGGDFVVVWTSAGQDGSGEGVYGRHFDADGAATGNEVRIHVDTIGDQTDPAVASDGAGGFLVTWQGNDSDNAGILARRLNATGAPAGAEFRVNTYTTSSQSRPAVAATAAGEFVVTWTSSFQVAPGDDVFAQRVRQAIFEDSFETAGVCAWSSSAGAGPCP